MFGDSITEAVNVGKYDRGHWTWADVLMGQRLDVSAFAGVGGNTTTQMLARIAADVIAGAPAWCLVMGGANDFAGGASAATVNANLQAIINRLLVNKIRVLLCTTTGSTSYDTSGKVAAWLSSVTWQRSVGRGNALLVADTAAAYTGDDGQPAAGYTYDGVHPTALGAYAMALKIQTAIESYLTARNIWLEPADAKLLHDYSYMLGTGGSKDSATGDAATGWKITRCVGEKVARTDSFGEWQQITPNSTSMVISAASYITTGFSVGDTLVAQCEVEIDDGWDGSYFGVTLQFRDAGSALSSVSCFADDPNAGDNPRPTSKFVLRTTPTVVPAGTTALNPYVYFGNTAGVVRVGRFEVRKL